MFLSKTYNRLMANVVKVNFPVSSHLHTSNIWWMAKKSSKDAGCGSTPVAIILCGVGGLDSTEIAEAVSLAIHCNENQLTPVFYAPDIEICGLVNHLTKKADNDSSPRNALIESARLARPTVKPLCECNACSAGALIIPGGYGAARTLSDFATKGASCTVLPELKSIMEEFNCVKKPIGTLCIATTLAAKVFKGARVTLGKEGPSEDWPYADAIKRVKEMGANVEMKDVSEVTYCKEFNIFSNPAWLNATANYAQVHQGIGNLISMLKKNISQ